MNDDHRRAERRGSRISPLVLVVLLCGVGTVASGASGCSSSDDAGPGDGADAAADNYAVDADPCGSYTAVGKTCSLQPGKVCFAQCQTGGCFCENGLWACRTDTSCWVDAGLDDGGFADDVTTIDSGTDADAAIDDAADAANALDADAGATDAPADADDAG